MVSTLFARALLAGLLTLLVPAGMAIGSGQPSVLLEDADRLRTADPARFQALLAQAESSISRMSPAQVEHLHYLRAYRAAMQGDYRHALTIARRLATEARSEPLRFRAALLVVNVGALTRDYVEAMRYLTRALEMAPGIEDPVLRDYASLGAANLYNELEQHSRALEHADRVLRQTTSPRNRCAAQEARTRAFAAVGEHAGDERFAQGIAACTAAGDPVGISLVRSNYGRYLLRGGQVADAVRELQQALPMARSTGYTRLIGELNATLATAHQRAGDDAAAEAAAWRAVASAGDYPHWRPLVVAHEVLYSVALARGDHRKALEHFRKHHAAQQADLDEARTRELAVRLNDQDQIVREQRNRTLAQENRILMLQREAADARARVLRLAVLCMGLVIVAVGYWAWQARRTQRALRRLNETDALTGLASRRHFAERAEQTLADCERRGVPVSVLLLDLDHFKRINDECGHAVGDWVLREAARTGQSRIGASDVFGRIGGEEFALLLPGRDALQGHAVAESFRMALGAIDGYAGGCHLPIAASIGVADSARSGYAYQRLLADADRAMYAAKMHGRNRTVVAGSVGVEFSACA